MVAPEPLRLPVARLAACAALALAAAAGATEPPRPAAGPGVPAAKHARVETKALAAPLAWHDGTAWRALRVDPSLEADFAPGAGAPGDPLRPAGATPKSAGAFGSPVLVDESGRLRALPGGAIVVLRAPLEDAAARALIASAGAVPARRLGETAWLVESPAGLASLELANRLHASGRFAAAQPNWWVRRTRK